MGHLHHISSSGVKEDHNTTASSGANRSGTFMSSRELHKIKIANSTMEKEVVPELQALTEEPQADVASGGQGLFSLRCVQLHTHDLRASQTGFEGLLKKQRENS